MFKDHLVPSLAIAVVTLLFSAAPSVAQSPPSADEPLFRHATGVIPESAEELRAFPRTPTYRQFLPLGVDLSRYFPVPGDQGTQSSCVGWAIGYAARAYYATKSEGRSSASPVNIPSPAYIFNAILEMPGNCDDGSKLSRGLQLLKSGALSLAEFPYNERACRAPTDQQRSQATDFRIESWMVVDHTNLDQIKGELAQGHPVILSMRARSDFHRLQAGQVYRRATGEPKGEFHALTVVGYDESMQAFRLINSWGRKWADGGFGWLGYDAFRTEARAAFVMRPARQVPLPTPSPPPKPPGPVVVGPSPKPPVPAVVVPSPSLPPMPTITGVECGLVTVTQAAGGLAVDGFVGTQGELDKVRNQAEALRAARFAVALRPWPQCEALMTLERGLVASDRPKIRIVRPAGTSSLTAGVDLVIEVETPGYPSYLHVAYVQADGKTVHLVQSDPLSLKAIAPRSRLVFGDGANGGARFKVTPPLGTEIAIAVASRSPLFADKRLMSETEREFLSALRTAVIARPGSTSKERVIAADYDAVSILERTP